MFFIQATKLDLNTRIRIGLIMFIESARALVDLVEICKTASKLTQGKNFQNCKS